MQNERDLPTDVLADANASMSRDVELTFVTVTHPGLTQTLRVVVEGDGGISLANGKPVNYRLDGELFKAVPFRLSKPDDSDRAAEARATIPSIDEELDQEIRSLTKPPRVRMQVLKASDFEEILDEDNARNPDGTPVVEYDANFLFLRDVSGNAMSLSGRLTRFDLGNEQYPLQRAIQALTPALFI